MSNKFQIKVLSMTIGAFVVGLAVSALADAMEGHIRVTPKEFEWKDGPGSIPKGAKFTVLEGDPSKAGPFTMRLKLPKNYEIKPHHHPAIEHVTVIEGEFHMGLGEKFDRKQSKALPVGSFAVMPIGHVHFAWTSKPTIIQLHGIGPWGITYVNPADDPRTATPPAATK